MQTIETKSQAHKVSHVEHMARRSAAIDHDFVFLISAERQKQLMYATPLDMQIAALEDARHCSLTSARQFYDSATRWLSRGQEERADDNFRYAQMSHERVRQYGEDIAKIVAERDARAMQ